MFGYQHAARVSMMVVLRGSNQLKMRKCPLDELGFLSLRFSIILVVEGDHFGLNNNNDTDSSDIDQSNNNSDSSDFVSSSWGSEPCCTAHPEVCGEHRYCCQTFDPDHAQSCSAGIDVGYLCCEESEVCLRYEGGDDPYILPAGAMCCPKGLQICSDENGLFCCTGEHPYISVFPFVLVAVFGVVVVYFFMKKYGILRRLSGDGSARGNGKTRTPW
eukprot:GEZU01022477.1.p1 GENE.GEZU01022477.1~~GEZU01022477.1.p1  ORF type:complete len:216 (-),score=12.31 GEZU01022477.1:74-721(-)